VTRASGKQQNGTGIPKTTEWYGHPKNNRMVRASRKEQSGTGIPKTTEWYGYPENNRVAWVSRKQQRYPENNGVVRASTLESDAVVLRFAAGGPAFWCTSDALGQVITLGAQAQKSEPSATSRNAAPVHDIL